MSEQFQVRSSSLYVDLGVLQNFMVVCLLGVFINVAYSLYKGPVKLVKRVKIARSFLQSVSDQFHVIILCLPV